MCTISRPRYGKYIAGMAMIGVVMFRRVGSIIAGGNGSLALKRKEVEALASASFFVEKKNGGIGHRRPTNRRDGSKRRDGTSMP